MRPYGAPKTWWSGRVPCSTENLGVVISGHLWKPEYRNAVVSAPVEDFWVQNQSWVHVGRPIMTRQEEEDKHPPEWKRKHKASRGQDSRRAALVQGPQRARGSVEVRDFRRPGTR